MSTTAEITMTSTLLVAAVFLSLTLVTGLLGMNVADLPGLENPAPFTISIVLVGVLVAGFVTVFKWKRWM